MTRWNSRAQHKSTLWIARTVILCLTLPCLLPDTHCRAQTILPQAPTVESKPEAAEPAELRVFILQHMPADDAERVLRTLVGDAEEFRFVIDSQGRMLVFARPKLLSEIEDVLTVLDQPTEDKAQLAEIKVFPLKNAEVASAAELLADLFPETAISFDQRTNTLVVMDETKQLEVIEAVLIHLDSDQRNPATGPATSYRIDLFWLVESVRELEENEVVEAVHKPDPRLDEVVAELTRQGFQTLLQLGQARVTARTGSQFSVDSINTQGRLRLSGFLNEADGQLVELQLQLDITAANARDSAMLITEITTTAGHNVVLGIAGATGDDRRSAFVVRVEK